MHFYCFLVKDITKWAEIFTGWFYYRSLDSCMEAFKDTLPIVCNGFKKKMYTVDNYYLKANFLKSLFIYILKVR